LVAVPRIRWLLLGALCALGAAAEPAAEPAAAAGARGGPPPASVPLGPFDGVIRPSATIPLGIPLEGRLATVLVDRGDPVRAGEVLASLECEVEELDLALAERNAERIADVEAARVRIEHARAILESRQSLAGLVSEEELRVLRTEERLAELALVEAEERRRIAALEVDRARARLALRRIESPFDGVVMARHKSAGELIDAATPVLTVARIDPLHVETILPIEHLGSIAAGDEAIVVSSAPGTPEQRARVERVDAVVDAASHTFGVRLALPNPAGRIAAGVRCTVRFER